MSMVLPGVVGFKLIGKLRTGVTATDIVLTVTQTHDSCQLPLLERYELYTYLCLCLK